MNLVIIGLGAGGFAAAITTRKLDRKCNITIVDPKSYDLMHPCGLPFALEGKISGEDLKHNQNLEQMKIRKITGRAVRIDSRTKQVFLEKGDPLPFDRLIIAAGSKPLMPPIKGIEGAFTLSDPENLEMIRTKLKTARTAAVIGAGAIGLEGAAAFLHLGLQVTCFEMAPSVMPGAFDPDMAGLIAEELTGKGMTLLTDHKVEAIGENSLEANGRSYQADIILNAAGFTPNLDLARESGLKMGERGIQTNPAMETSIPGIYAVGDCAETTFSLTGKAILPQLATTAYRQGVIAANHITGKGRTYSGTLMTFVSQIGELESAAAGLTEKQARALGYDVLVSKAKGSVKPEWMPDKGSLAIKLIIDKKKRCCIGAQAVGSEGANSRINVLSLAIKEALPVESLLDLELGYCPAVSQTWDVINTAIEMALRRM